VNEDFKEYEEFGDIFHVIIVAKDIFEVNI